MRVRKSSNWRSESVVRKSPAYVDRFGPSTESTTSLAAKTKNYADAGLEKVQRLVLRLNGQRRDGSRDVELHTRKCVATQVEADTDRAGRKNLQATAIIDGEFISDITDGRPVGLCVFFKCKNGTQANHNVRPDFRQRRLQHKVAGIDDGFGIRFEEIRGVPECMFAADHLSMGVSNSEHAKRSGIEVAGCSSLSRSIL